MVGRGRDVRTHDRRRVEQAGAVLDDQAAAGVGVVAAPNLGAVVEHAAVKAGTAARAVFQQQADHKEK